MTMTWPELHPLVWIPVSVLVTILAGVTGRLLYAQPTHMAHAPERRARPIGLFEITSMADAVRKLPPIGIVSLIAVYLVYVLATAIPAKLDAHAAETQKQIRMLQQICVNTSATDAARATCWGLDR